MNATLRRLDDRERYWGLSWPGWVAATGAAGVLYLAVRFSPLGTKPTITITLFGLAFAGMVLYGVSGQALSPGQQLLAILSYRRSRKLLELSDRIERRGLVLDSLPPTDAPTPPAAADADGSERLAVDDEYGYDDEEIDADEDRDAAAPAAPAAPVGQIDVAQHTPNEDDWGDENLSHDDAQPPGTGREDR
jgi:hypothetical protein